MNLLRLFGFKVLLISCTTMLLLKIFLIDSFIKETALSNIQFLLLLFSVLCILSAGNLLYNVSISSNVLLSGKKTTMYYTTLTIAGVLTGFYLAYSIERTAFSVFFVLLSLLLYWYSNSVRMIAVAANLYISILAGLLVFVVPLFDLLPVLNESNAIVIRFIFNLLIIYAVLASVLCLLREILKDILLMKLHHAKHISSLPLLLGKSRSLKIVSIISAVLIILLFVYTNLTLYRHSLLTAYVIFVLMAPLMYLAFVSWNAKKDKLIAFLSDFLLMVMVLGIASVIILKFTIFRI